MKKREAQISERIGTEYINKQNEKVIIIEYNKYTDIVVQFEDGTKKKTNFKATKMGLPLNPNNRNPYKSERLGKVSKNNQECEMKIIEYRDANDIDVEFIDGTIIKNRAYDPFIRGMIYNPNWGKDRIGEKSISTQGEDMEIIDFFSIDNISVKFSDGTIVYNKRYDHFKDGNIKNYNRAYLYDKGYLGFGKYQKASLQGRKWTSMFERCYKKEINKNRTYKAVEVSKDWYCLQDFGKWFDENLWSEDCTHLDKDILIKNNLIYSPSNCILVDNYINTFFAYKRNKVSNLPTGVIQESENSYRAYLKHNGNNIFIKWFKTSEEAFCAYKIEKELIAKEIAETYSKKYSNFPKELYNALYNFKVEK